MTRIQKLVEVKLAVLEILRPKQWIKNLLVLAVPLSAGKIFQIDILLNSAVSIVVFCAISSSIYILNDINDFSFDRKHPLKSKRPIANGKIKKSQALFLFTILVSFGFTSSLIFSRELFYITALYFFLQLNYVYKFKNIFLIDMFIISCGFVIRAVAGGYVSNIEISQWFLLVIFSLALLIISGKRYSELMNPLNSGTRIVLNFYSPEMLKTIWSMSLNCSVVFYTLWAIELGNEDNDYLALVSVVPFIAILLIFIRILEKGNLEAPEEIILKDRAVLFSGFVWLSIFLIRIYG
jgi:decaprenyl-phosphate phosphoribosyltransferase